MGTFVELVLPIGSAFDELTNGVFADIERLENKFSFFSVNGLLSSINRAPVGAEVAIDEEMHELLRLSLRVRDTSGRKFSPFVDEQKENSKVFRDFPKLEFSLRRNQLSLMKVTPFELDLGGIAKGFIVDQVVERLVRRAPGVEGSINAGGDIRFFGQKEPCSVTLRVGSAELGLVRELTMAAGAVATSSPDFADKFAAGSCAQSQTSFQRAAWPGVASVTVLAKSCALADALAKVALFSSQNEIELYAHAFAEEDCQILRFDSQGRLLDRAETQSVGECEAGPA